MITSVVEKANVFSADNNRAYSNRGSREDKCDSSERVGIRTRTGSRGSS